MENYDNFWDKLCENFKKSKCLKCGVSMKLVGLRSTKYCYQGYCKNCDRLTWVDENLEEKIELGDTVISIENPKNKYVVVKAGSKYIDIKELDVNNGFVYNKQVKLLFM
jgi:hypothetical protein